MQHDRVAPRDKGDGTGVRSLTRTIDDNPPRVV